MIFAYICAFQLVTFCSDLNSFLSLQNFFGLKMQKSTNFYEKMVLRVVFIKLTLRWLQTGLNDLKNTKQLKFCLLWIFLCIFKMLHFKNKIHPYFLVKLLNALNFI